MIAYRADQELPTIGLQWLDRDGAVVDFSTGWTFTVKIAAASAPNTVLATKSSGITGSATSPNVIIDWSTSDFSTLTPASTGTVYVLHVYARRNSDSKDRVFKPGSPLQITLYPAPA